MSNIFSENPIASISTIVALFGLIAAHRLMLHREKRKRRFEASDKFKNTILIEFSKLYPNGILHFKETENSEIVQILRDKHCTISTAVLAYRPHVRNKRGFNKAWNNFVGIGRFHNNDDKPTYNQYRFKGTHCYDSPREMFIKNIDKLLKFTETT